MPPSAVCDYAGTEMSLEEQLKQPWSKNVKRPMRVGDPCSYPPTINQIHFEEDYVVRWNSLHGYQVWKGITLIGSYMGILPAIQSVKGDSEARCLKDLQAARTAWEAEQKRKQAPGRLNLHAYYELEDGKYVLMSGIGHADTFTLGENNFSTHPRTFRTIAPKEIPLEAVI